MTSHPTGAGKLERTLGLFDLTCLVMGAIVGVGIFFQPARVAAITGSGGLALLAWGVGGAIALTGALSFAELGTLFPHTGGQYLILKTAYGKPVGFLYCWALLTVIQSGAIGIIAIIFIQYAAALAGRASSDVETRLLAVLTIALLAATNVIGVRYGTRLANLAMVLKAAALLFVASLALVARAPHVAATASAATGTSALVLVATALVPVMFSFGGWQQATYVGGEVKNPDRVMPLGILGGVAGVVFLYLTVNIGYLGLLGTSGMAASKALAADAVGVVFPGIAHRLTAAAVAISALGIANVCLLSGPRMYKAIADDGCFFAAIGRVHADFKTPANAIAVQAAVAMLLVLTAGMKGVDYMTTGVVAVDLVFFAMTGLAVFVLRRKLPDAPRPYRAWGYPLLPAIFVLAILGALAGAFMDPATRSASVIALAVLVSGGIAFLLLNRQPPIHDGSVDNAA